MHTTHNPVPGLNRCESVPDLDRVCYYLGQLLGPQEFVDEHEFFANKLALIVSRLLGHGVVCGLEVDSRTAPPDGCKPPDQDLLAHTTVSIAPGLAVDCDGQLVIVRRPLDCDLWTLLSPSDRLAAATPVNGVRPPLYVSLRFSEWPVGCGRPLGSDACAPTQRHQPSRARECVDVEVTLKPPEASRCDACCDTCADPRVLIATVHQTTAADGVVSLSVDETVRRPFGRTQLTTISGISWVHGAAYAADDAGNLLTRGFALRFSAPVDVESLSDPHLVEVGIHTGGTGNRDSFIPRTVSVRPGDVHGTTARELWVRVEGSDRLSDGDLVRINVRCDFILDHCCRAVDGDHLGGRVPAYEPTSSPYTNWRHCVPAKEPRAPSRCVDPPTRRGPWESGNGSPGGTFHSWITVTEPYMGGRP